MGRLNIFKLVLFSSLMLLQTKSISQNLDINILKNINVNRNKSFDPTFKFITNSLGPISAIGPLSVLATGFLSHDKALKNKGVFMVESIIASTIITDALKYTVKRKRPFETYTFIDKQAKAGSPSFPSGHTSASFNLATSLTISFPKWYVIAPSFAYASAVGYSRMHLGVHYPSDVIAGAIIGSGSAWLCHYINQRYFNRKK